MNTNTIANDQTRASVREHYAKVATAGSGCGCAPSCCNPNTQLTENSTATAAHALGYSATDTSMVPDGANLGLGCGNPLAIASLKRGQTVLDLGSGAGIDVFLASRAVGPTGQVIGVDMTPDMILRARQNASRGAYANVDFRLGEIEKLPVANSSIDVIISNCVINLSPDKQAVFSESFRVLKPGGRIAISDIVALAPFPKSVMEDMAVYSGCVGGAELAADIERSLRAVGFEEVRVTPKPESAKFIAEWFPGRGFEDYVASVTIEALKPWS